MKKRSRGSAFSLIAMSDDYVAKKILPDFPLALRDLTQPGYKGIAAPSGASIAVNTQEKARASFAPALSPSVT
jgi:hypothetical protein